jgi:hypothetical protein
MGFLTNIEILIHGVTREIKCNDTRITENRELKKKELRPG